MKKIIATVLAMVMAMALCVTAFAVNYTDGYYFADGKWNKIDLTKVTVSYTNPSETKTDGKVTSAKIGYYTLKNTDGSEVVLVEADKDDATYQIKADSTVKYLVKSNGHHAESYTLTGTKLTSSEKCGQVKFQGEMYTAGGKYYVPGTGAWMLVDGQVIAVAETTVTVNPHHFEIKTKAIDAKGVVTGTAKCKDCDQTATLTNKLSVIPVGAKSMAADDIEGAGAGTYLYWTEKGAAAGTTTTNGSPKTFDAGIAMYAGMALMSVAGSAVVIGKKKEF